MLRADNNYGEESDDNYGTAPLIVGASYDISSSQGSIVSVGQEHSDVYKSRWRSIRVMYLVMFLGSVTFTITMSSLWPFLQVLDPAASTSFLGWVVAAYSLGQLVASPFFGGWANLRKNSREPLAVSLVLTTLSNVFYMYLQSLPLRKDVFMILARGLIGFSAGNVAVVRSYVSGATTTGERTGSMANLSIFQAMGFILGPVIQAALVPIGYPGPVEAAYFHFNMYTAPGFCAAVVATISVFLLVFVFKEHRVYDDDIKAILQSSSNSVGDQGTAINTRLSDSLLQMEYKIDYLAVCSNIFLFFIVLFMFTVFETIGTPLTMDMYAWNKTQATLYQGIILGAAGCLSIVVFMLVKILAKRYSERCLLLGGFIFCLCGYFTFIPWGNQLPPIGFSTINNTISSPDAIFTLTDYLIHGGQEDALRHISKRDTSFLRPRPDLVHNFAIPVLAYSNDVAPINGHLLDIFDGSDDDFVELPFRPDSGVGKQDQSSERSASTFLMVRNVTADSTTSLDTTTSDGSSITTSLGTTTSDGGSITTSLDTTTSDGSNITTSLDTTTSDGSSITTSLDTTTSDGSNITTSLDTTTSIHIPTYNTTTNTPTTHTPTTNTPTTNTTTNNPTTNTPTTNTNNPTTNNPTTNTQTTNTQTTNTTISPNGCPFEWCQHVPVIYLGQFLGGTVLISIGYPVCQMLSYALYSKMLGPKPQGLWMGWLTAAGSLARTIGPIYVSQIYDSFGPQVTFGSCCGIIALTIVFYLAVFRRMVPFTATDASLSQVAGSTGGRRRN